MINSLLLTKIGIWLFLAAFLVALFNSDKKLNKILIATFIAATFTFVVAFLIRWGESYKMGIGHFPISNAFESFFAFAMFLGIITSLLTIKIGINRNLLGGTALLAGSSMGYITFFTDLSKSIEPLNPALQSNWLTWHVLVSFLSYAGFGISFIAAILYLVRISKPDADKWSQISDWGIVFGFPLLTAGIREPIGDGIRKKSGVLSVYLHLKRSGKTKKTLAIVSIIGFISVLITYVGVNFFLSGLHSYGSA